MPSLTADQIDSLARTYFEEALSADEEQRLRAPTGRAAYTETIQEDESPVDADLNILSRALDDTREALAENDFRAVDADVGRLLAAHGLSLDRDTLEYRRLAQMLLRAHIQVMLLAQARRSGDYGVQPDDPAFVSLPPVIQPPTTSKSQSPKLSDLAAEYTQAKVCDKVWKPHTERNYVPKLKLFSETIGDIPASAVTRDHLRDWRDALEDLDLAPNTIALHFKVVSSFFNWMKDENKAKTDLSFRKLAPKAQERTREAFQPEDLKRLFAAPLYTGHWRADRRERPGRCLVKDAKYWLPLIALHSGMRVEEIAKLKTSDLREIDGVWCFDIYETKTEAGDRQVPIHPCLVSLGLLEYLQSSKGGQLWPDLQKGSEGKYSQRFVQWWAEFRHLIGLDRDGLVFHSFRHTFAGSLQQAQVPEATVALLIGHRHSQLTFGRYGGKLITPRDKLKAIEGLDFGVDLSHLHKGRHTL